MSSPNRQSPRLTRRDARRLLDGESAVRGSDARLAELLDALAVVPHQAESEVPAELLAAFAEGARGGGADDAAQGAVHEAIRPVRSGARGRRRGGRVSVGRVSLPRSRSLGRALAVKSAVVALALSGGTVAAAAADALPGPAQRAVHDLFSSWGVPGPSEEQHDRAPAQSTTDAGSAMPGGASAEGGPSPSASSAVASAASASGSVTAAGDKDVGRHRGAGPGSSPDASACATHGHEKDHRCATREPGGPGQGTSSPGDGPTGSAAPTASPGPSYGPVKPWPPGRPRHR